MLTCPEIAATTGVQTTWAASGTAIASASGRGIQLANESRQIGASSRMPPVASTDKQKPTERANHGSASTKAMTARHSARMPLARPPAVNPTMATTPMAAARSTLGCGLATRTKNTTASTPTTVSQRPRTRHHRATSMTKPSTRVTLAPETASR